MALSKIKNKEMVAILENEVKTTMKITIIYFVMAVCILGLFLIKPNKAQAGMGADVDKIISLLTQIESNQRTIKRYDCACKEMPKEIINKTSKSIPDMKMGD